MAIVKKILLVFAAASISFSLKAQICGYHHSITDGSEFCNFYEKGISTVKDKNAEIAIDKILSVIGAAKKFILVPCSNINNCSAASYKGERYIIYDEYFINEISSSNDAWVKLSILAHEVGHHINGHTLDIALLDNDLVKPNSLKENREMELEADQFSGFVMAKLGATLKQSQEAINFLGHNGDDTYSSHPSKPKRLKAIENGYNSGKGIDNPNPYKSDPNNLTYEDYLYRAHDFYQDGNYQLAISNYTKAIELKSDMSKLYSYRATMYYFTKDLQSAYNDIVKVIQLDPYDFEAYNLKGNLLSLNGEYEKAIESYKKTVQINSKYGTGYKNIAVEYYTLGKYQLTLDYINKAIELEPGKSYSYIVRGNVFDKQNQNWDAIKNYDKAIDIEKINLAGYVGKARVYLKVEQHELSLENINKALDIDPKNSYVLVLYGKLAYDLKKFDIALRYYTKVIVLDPNDSETYYNRGLCKLNLEDRYGACKDFSKAGELGLSEAYDLISKYCK